MELCSIQPPSVIPRKCLIQEHLKYGHFIKSLKRSHKVGSVSRNFKFVNYNVRAAGLLQCCTMSRTSQSVETVPNDIKDEDLIFVAGATGKVGSRTVRELLKLGFKVRAGVRSVQRAEALVESVKQMKLDDTTQPIEKLELVECDLEKREQIRPALSDASVVICCIGASEKEVLDITGPYRIDFQATKNLIDAATVSKVKHFVLVTSLGTNKVGFPAAILNLFWGVLIWKRKAEEELIASGLPYTIVRPGGMERPTDSYKETHNITLSIEDTLFGGQVSNLQVAELLACMAKNRGLSYCKIVEVIAETTAPLIPMEELLAKIPSQRDRTYIEEPSSTNVPEPDSKSVSSESPSIPTEKQDNQSKQASARPLSPYTAYEDLKPPVSPTPKAPGRGSKEVTVLETAPGPTPADSEASINSATVVESAAVAAKISRPLSPYAVYEDLKPPVSPTPKAPGRGSKEVTVLETAPGPTPADSEASINSATVVESAAVGAKISRPLSPYAVYEDLKPPTSPTPTPSGPREIPSQSTTGNGVATTKDGTVVEKNPSQNSSSNHSPYPVYDNFKPPTSPSPTAPTVSVNNGNNLTPVPKPQPLSPFTMYDDLKPPSSPTPSAPKI